MARDAAATQEKLLAAARRHFALHGYERTTVRAVAEEAQVNVALISRYFGGKEELFAQAVAIDLRLPDLKGLQRGEIGIRLVEHFFRRWEGDQADDLLRVLIRTASTHPSAAAKMRHILNEQLLPLVIQISGEAGARSRAGLVATQILGLAFSRYVLELDEGYIDPTSSQVLLGQTIERYLFAKL